MGGQPISYRKVRKPATKGLIREIGADAITILKNTGSLPLKKPGRIAVLGETLGFRSLIIF